MYVCFAFIHHGSAKLMLMFDSSTTLSNISAIINVFHSTRSLLDGASAVVSLNTIFVDWHISVK